MMGRKGFFGSAIQATVDHRTRFTSFEMAFSAAVTDSRMFRQSHLFQNRHQYFKDGRYVLADKGYPTTAIDKRRMRHFNKLLSSVRISVEHAFGALKGRFPSLRCMGAHKDPDDIYRVIEALIVLHNMMLFIGDKPEHIWTMNLDSENQSSGDEDRDEGFEGDIFEDDPNIPEHETDAWLKAEGYRLRIKIFNDVCPIEDYQ
ncbi:hypothetical protein BDZ89DRAFT_313433 [Hymenopellis radicata]|nr:hypothetical protein BDZ89DRAFT_313433 [Hymenopellis radicata]